MGWLVKDKLSERKHREAIEEAQEVLRPGETILDVTVGKIEVPGSHGRGGISAVTDQRVFLHTEHSGHSEVRDFTRDQLTR
jgi:hypothetical protein